MATRSRLTSPGTSFKQFRESEPGTQFVHANFGKQFACWETYRQHTGWDRTLLRPLSDQDG